MTQVTGLKKIISVALLGSLLVTGAVVYADTATADTAAEDVKAGLHMKAAPKGAFETSLLSKMVKEGVITQEEKDAMEKAMETQRAQFKAAHEAQEALTVKPEAGTKPVSHYARLAEAGLISQTLADKMDAYMTAQRETAFSDQVKPLVDNGTFRDTAAVKTALDAVRDEIQALHEAAMTKVYSDLVTKGTLTQSQADALEALKGPGTGLMDGDRGHGRGPGHGPGETGVSPTTATTTTAE